MQKLRRFEDDFIFLLPILDYSIDDLHVILGYSLKAPKIGTKFDSCGCVYIVCHVDTVDKVVICKHA